MFSTTKRLIIIHALIAALLLLGSATAAGGFRLGATAGITDSGLAGLNVRAAYSFLDLGSVEEPLRLSVRADMGFSLTQLTLPALGLALVLTADPPGPLSAYLGGGPGLTLPSEAAPAFASAYAFTGVGFQLTDALTLVLEAGANLNTFGIFTSLGLGLDYRFGITR